MTFDLRDAAFLPTPLAELAEELATMDLEDEVRALERGRLLLSLTLRTSCAVALAGSATITGMTLGEDRLNEKMGDGRWLNLLQRLARAKGQAVEGLAAWLDADIDGWPVREALNQLVAQRNRDAHPERRGADVDALLRGLAGVLREAAWMRKWRIARVVHVTGSVTDPMRSVGLRWMTGGSSASGVVTARSQVAACECDELVLVEPDGEGALRLSPWLTWTGGRVAVVAECSRDGTVTSRDASRLAESEKRLTVDGRHATLSRWWAAREQRRSTMWIDLSDAPLAWADPVLPGRTRQPGQRLRGRFVLVERRGAGGMAEVWKVRDEAMEGRVVAAKIMHDSLADDGDASARFQREATTWAKLNHPNIVGPVELHGAMTDPPFVILMPLIEGGSAERLLYPKGRPAETVRDLARAMLSALAYLADQGLVHRDVKPANILVHAGAWRLTDFGLVQSKRYARNPLTRTDATVGTDGYMAPEQRTPGAKVTDRADVYALGATLSALWLGTNPRELAEVADEDPQLAWLIEQMQEPVPSRRPSAGDALRLLDGPREQLNAGETMRGWGLAAKASVAAFAAAGAASLSVLMKQVAEGGADDPVGPASGEDDDTNVSDDTSEPDTPMPRKASRKLHQKRSGFFAMGAVQDVLDQARRPRPSESDDEA